MSNTHGFSNEKMDANFDNAEDSHSKIGHKNASSNAKVVLRNEQKVDESKSSTMFDLRAVIVIGLLLPWAFPVVLDSLQDLPSTLGLPHNWDESRSIESFLSSHFPWSKDPSFLCLLTALSAPHLFYFWVWTHPLGWKGLCRDFLPTLTDPCHAFAMVAYFLKLLQGLLMAAWLRGRDSGGIVGLLRDIFQAFFTPGLVKETTIGFASAAYKYIAGLNTAQALLGIELILFGQILNVSVYKAIGEHGVYYGCRLGKVVPWCDGFPFNFLPHPQYLGSSLSIWGVCIFLGGMIPYGVPVVMSCFYAFSSWVEATL
mmetsp:Transcript_28836/g.42862  ORF Transcript_28836/g.42862 Transcript_28836/m.42862 type:complete len:314 (-) Transcript_28836:677-1618(-)